MVSIADVPYRDIKKFLSDNKIKWAINDNENYIKVLEMIKAGKGVSYSDNLIDWIIAYNFYNEGNKIKTYTKEEIDQLNDAELNKLAKYLGIFDSNDVEKSAINVLKYLKKLDIKHVVPVNKQKIYSNNYIDYSKNQIIHPDIDQHIFSLSRNIDQQKILSSKYDEIIKIFKQNKSLRNFIYDNLEKIIKNNSYEDGDYISGGLGEFIIDLMAMNEIGLAKEVLRVSSKIITDEDARKDLISESYYVTENEQVTEEYFKLLPYIRTLFPVEAYSDENIIDIYLDTLAGTSTEYFNDTLLSFFEAAIKAKNRKLADWARDIWLENERLYTEPKDKLFVNKMDALAEEAKFI